jgi:endonuclease III
MGLDYKLLGERGARLHNEREKTRQDTQTRLISVILAAMTTSYSTETVWKNLSEITTGYLPY